MLMLVLAAVLMGIIGYNSMRVEENPDVTFGVVTVTTIYPGAGPEEINTLVSRVIEEAVSSVSDLRETTSTSQEGVSTVVLQFEIGTNMDAALNEVRSKVDAVLSRLPREVESPVIDKFDFAAEPILYMVLKSDTLDNRQLRDLADRQLKDRFARISGVASVGVRGGDEREIKVEVSRDALLRHGVGILEIQQALSRAAVNVPSGRVTDGDDEYTVRVLGDFEQIDDIGRIEVRFGPQEDQKRIRLDQLATVSDGVKERRVYSRLNGADAVVIVIQKAKEGNAVTISDSIRKGSPSLLQQIEREFDVQVVVSLDSATQIRESLFDLQFALGFGILLVTLVVFIFLHNFRGMLIIAIAIPICLMLTLMVLWLTGNTINTLTMLAMSLAIGVLVDDAIVIIENIYRHLRLGESPVQAAINGRAEIGLAAIAITLADVVVFVPLMFMGGVIGQFFKPLAIGYATAVLASLFVSFTITPMLASRWYRSGEDWENPSGRFARGFEAMFTRFSLGYRRVLAWSLGHRWFVFITGFVVLLSVFMFIGGSFGQDISGAARVGMPLLFIAVVFGVIVFVVNIFRGHTKPRFILFGFLFGLAFPAAGALGYLYGDWKNDQVFKFSFFPPTDSGTVAIDIELPPNASLAATSRVVASVERIAIEHPDAEYVLSTIGSQVGGFQQGSQATNLAQISVTLHEKKAIMDTLMFWRQHDGPLRTRSADSVAADLLQAIGRVPNADIKVAAGGAFGFGAPIQMSFRSDNADALRDSASAILEGLQSGVIDGVVTPEKSSRPGKPELQVVPDRARMGDAGLDTSQLGSAMRVLYEGDDSAKLRVLGQEYDIRLQMVEGDRADPDLVSRVPVTFSEGTPIYLTEVAEIVRSQGVDKIDRRDRQQEIQITANLLPGYAPGSVQREIDLWMEREGLIPPDVSYQPLGEADVQARETGFLLAALFLGLILVYMLLASLYDNLLYPFIIQLAQPQAFVGALIALMITDKTLNLVGFIGLIALVGLVGKNAILLVDYTNTLRNRGKIRLEAILESGQTRLRPIMMTTLSLIAGMLPIALAIGRGSEFRETIGITIIGGVTLSTLLTLLVIPCSYTIFDDISESFARFKRRRLMGGRPNSGDDEDSSDKDSSAD